MYFMLDGWSPDSPSPHAHFRSPASEELRIRGIAWCGAQSGHTSISVDEVACPDCSLLEGFGKEEHPQRRKDLLLAARQRDARLRRWRAAELDYQEERQALTVPEPAMLGIPGGEE